MAAEFRILKLRSPARLRAAARGMAACDPWRKLGLSEKACLAGLTAPYRATYGAFARDRLAGHVTINMSGTLRGYIQVLFVADGFRGRGAGETLMRFAEKKIFAASPNVFLCVSSFNKGARRFYTRLGYRKAGLFRDFLVKGADEVLMRKTRGPLTTFRPRK